MKMTLVLTHQAMVVDLILQEEIAQEVAITVMAIGERDESEEKGETRSRSSSRAICRAIMSEI